MAPGNNVRVGDADREAVAAQLREHYADGRLTLEELNERIDQTFAAKTKADLNTVMLDLPHAATGPGPRAARRPAGRDRWLPGQARAMTRGAGHTAPPAPSPRCSAWSGCW